MEKLPVDYATRDFTGFFEQMKESIPLIAPEWTDLEDSDNGIAILQSLSVGLHILSFYQENALRESMLVTARTKEGILNGATFLGYKVGRQEASKAIITFTKDEDYLDVDCYVPIGTQIGTDDKDGPPIIFETTETLFIKAGEISGEVEAIQGETIQEEFLTQGQGTPNQRVVISNPDVLVDSLEVYTVENGFKREWILVDTLLYSGLNDRHYTISLDEEDRTEIRFGDGIMGKIPGWSEAIYVNYRYGGGSYGNLSTGLINTIVDTEFDLGFLESVTNKSQAFGGTDYEDLDLVKMKAPKQYRIGESVVSAIDAEDFISMYPGVIRVKSEETFKNDFYLYILFSEEFRGESEDYLNQMLEDLDKVRLKNTRVIMREAEVQEFDIKLKVYVGKTVDMEEVELEITENIRDYYSESYFDFGQPFYSTRVHDIAYDSRGVRNVELIETEDIILDGKGKILVLRDVEVEVLTIE